MWPLPLSARVPIVSGGLILAVALLASRVMMATVAREQESGVRRIEAVYLDGIATTVYPHIVARNLDDTIEVAAPDHVVPPGHERAAGDRAAAGW